MERVERDRFTKQELSTGKLGQRRLTIHQKIRLTKGGEGSSGDGKRIWCCREREEGLKDELLSSMMLGTVSIFGKF